MNPLTKILVVDDEAPIRRLLKLVLSENGYQMLEADKGALAVSLAATGHPDSIILDLGLPDLDGHEVIRRIREWSDVPILVLSVREGMEDKVKALDAGADDYITKPFSAEELLARLRAIFRRKQGFHEMAELTINDLCMNFEKHEVRIKGQEVHLTQTEYQLLSVLCKNAGKVVTHKQLLKTVWGPYAEERADYLRVYVTHLRKKLERMCDKSLIRTEPSVGYRLLDA